MPEWIPMFAMPNVQPQKPIEIDGIAFVSVFDDRIKALRAKYANYDSYLNQFSNEFGVKVNPSTIMVWEDSPPIYKRVDALGSFRDAIAISSISKTWAHILRYGGHMDGPRYSNTFSFYPWLLDKNYKNVATQSIATFGIQQLPKMHGQSVPALSFCRLLPNMIDDALLDELLRRWARRYSTETPHWTDRALFRSLNMATAAANLPGHADITLYDLGRLVALWVSAFEILAHPPYGRQNGYKQVYGLLKAIQWGLSQQAKTLQPVPPQERYAAVEPALLDLRPAQSIQERLPTWQSRDAGPSRYQTIPARHSILCICALPDGCCVVCWFKIQGEAEGRAQPVSMGAATV
jgi:hypothetical protein